MTRAYKLKPTRPDHPVKQRPFLHELLTELQHLEDVGVKDLEAIEHLVKRRGPAPAPSVKASEPAAAVDMSKLIQDAEDQGEQGACFAFAGTHAQNLCDALALTAPAPSLVKYAPACLSWNTRVLMGTTDQDSGGNLGDAIQAQEQVGTCVESLMPYSDQVFNVPPSPAAVGDEATHKATFRAYPLDLSDPQAIPKALSAGYPVYFGFWVWRGFENTGSDGLVPAFDGTNLGGHAQLAFYDPGAPSGTFGDQNSWATSWGKNGNCYFPLAAAQTVMEAYGLVPVSA